MTSLGGMRANSLARSVIREPGTTSARESGSRLGRRRRVKEGVKKEVEGAVEKEREEKEREEWAHTTRIGHRRSRGQRYRRKKDGEHVHQQEVKEVNAGMERRVARDTESS